MKGCFDFTVDELGPCKVLSPIHLSKEKEDFRANYVSDTEFVRYNIDVDEETELNEAGGCSKNIIQKAGPREYIYFNPKHVNAGICTCGGLCPGINDVVRAIVRCLYNRYGVRRIRGVRFGFKGFFPEYGFDTIDLNPDLVDDIHKTGGSFLGTSRGGGDRVTDIVDAIEALNMNMLFIVGGDGTQRGALEVAEEVEKRGLKVSIVGVPKTVDNDLIFIQKSFGFDTAVQKATEAVAAAHMEARSHINGIGLIKLMGRESGFIATATALASAVLPTPVGPKKMKVPIGLSGFFNPDRLLFIAFTTLFTAMSWPMILLFILLERLVSFSASVSAIFSIGIPDILATILAISSFVTCGFSSGSDVLS